MKTFYTAIFTKFNAVDGGGDHNSFWTDIGGRMFFGEAPENVAWPYCVVSHIASTQRDTFKDKIDDILVQFSIFSSNPSSAEVHDAMTHLKALFDDATLSITGDTLVYFIRGVEGLERDDIDTPDGLQRGWHYHVDYDALVQR